MRNLKVSWSTVLYECTKCWSYLSEEKFSRSKRCQYWLRPVCKSCETKKMYNNKPLTVDEALAILNKTPIKSPTITVAPDPEPVLEQEKELSKGEERELDKRTNIRCMKFYKNIWFKSKDQHNVWVIWYYDTLAHDSLSKKDYRATWEMLDVRFTSNIEDINIDWLIDVVHAMEARIRGLWFLDDAVQDKAVEKWMEFYDYFKSNKKSKLEELTQYRQWDLLK